MLLVFSTLAWGSTLYPSEVQTLSGASCEPACTVCHSSNTGGSGTVTQPFGMEMTSRGLTGGSNTVALADAYTQLIDDDVDSDGDGTSDAEALASDLDPNTGLGLCGGESPTFGCLSHSPAVPALGLFGVLMVAARRRRA